MSHHFDTKLAKEDPSLNLCDFYLFHGPSGKTVMAMTVNPDVGLSAPDTLHPEGLYAFRFDLNGDAREEVTFKFRFGEPRHGDGSEHTHIQPFVVRKATGDDALRGDAGESLVEGETGSVATNSGLRAYVGIAPELFAANAGFGTFMTAFYKDQRYDGDAFLHQQNPFARRNVTAIVLEVPSELIGKGKINAWATISLFGHAPEVQVSRWGLPMVTHLFLNDPSDQEVKEQFNASVPEPYRSARRGRALRRSLWGANGARALHHAGLPARQEGGRGLRERSRGRGARAAEARNLQFWRDGARGL